MSVKATVPVPVWFPTLDSECNDTERRSLQKINILQSGISASLAALNKPGAAQVAFTNYVYGIQYQIPAGADLLDVGCYNPNDTDVWVYVVLSSGGPQPGMRPTFPIRVYAHNHAYYEAMTSGLSVPGGQRFDLAVSSTETTLTWANPVYLAIRHS